MGRRQISGFAATPPHHAVSGGGGGVERSYGPKLKYNQYMMYSAAFNGRPFRTVGLKRRRLSAHRSDQAGLVCTGAGPRRDGWRGSARAHRVPVTPTIIPAASSRSRFVDDPLQWASKATSSVYTSYNSTFVWPSRGSNTSNCRVPSSSARHLALCAISRGNPVQMPGRDFEVSNNCELGHVHASTKGPDPAISRFRSGSVARRCTRRRRKAHQARPSSRRRHAAIDAPAVFSQPKLFCPQGPLCRNRVISGGDWQASRRSSKGGGSA
jgi:hypothetical protein